jgi:hypothetical protein
MRHGRKSQHQRFDGYKFSAAATNTAEPPITSVEVAPASEQDGPKAAEVIDAQPEARRRWRGLGDAAYGIGSFRADMAARNVQVLAPVSAPRVKEGRLAKRDFHLDLDAGTVTCPAGQDRPDSHRALRAAPRRLRQAPLRSLPAREGCVAPGPGRRSILIAPHEGIRLRHRVHGASRVVPRATRPARAVPLRLHPTAFAWERERLDAVEDCPVPYSGATSASVAATVGRAAPVLVPATRRLPRSAVRAPDWRPALPHVDLA